MPVLAAAAALAGAGGLYKYQRENFMFDAEQKIKREYQAQDMRIKQFELYREDVRDLVELTVSKMDNYLVVNALQLGFCVILLTEGRPDSGMSPDWLIWLYAICAVGSFIYFLLSIWLAIHASISAHSFGVRLLTQFVRLPTPNTKQLDAARAKAVDYEGQSFGQLFRIPLWKQQLRRLTDALDEEPEQDDGAADENEAAASPEQDDTFNPAAMLEHVKKYRELQAHWQSYDAFARVSMNLGTSQFLQGLSYYIIIVFEVEIESPWAAITACLLVTMAAYVVMRLDVQASALEHWMIKLFLLAPPVLVFTAYIKENNDGVIASFVPTVFLLQGLWIGYLVYLAWAKPGKGPNEPALPTRFRSILYLDVFGWVNEPTTRSERSQGRELQAPQGGPERMEAVEERASEEAVAEAGGLGLEGGSDGGRPAALTDSQVMMRELKGSRGSGADSGTGAASSAEVTPAKPLPSALHASLVELCWKVKWQLDADIKHWESREVFGLIDDDPSTQQEIGTLRSRFDYLVVQLRDAEPEGEHMVEKDLDPNPVWLMLEWNPSGHAMTYFYNCRDGRTVWTVPEPPDRIFDLDHMQKQVADFQDKVVTVINYNPVPAPSLHGSESRGGAENSFVSGGGTPHRPSTAAAPAIPEDTEPANGRAAGGSRPQAEPLLPRQPTVRFAEGEAEVSEPVGQLNREESDHFGGHEAVRLDRNPAVNNTWFGVSPMTAATFHPHQAPLTSSTPRRKSPGIMPWKSFLHASFALIACWIIGFLWAFITFTLDWDIPWLRRPAWYGDDNTQQLAAATGEPTLLYAGDWPHPYFRPEGMSCNVSDNGDVTLWVLERYAVHELHLRDGSASRASAAGMAKLQTSLEGCLAQAPEFHAGGFQSMGLECEKVGSRPHACFAVLFSATLERNGTRAMLRCSLDRYAAEPEHFRIHGRDWHGFTSGGRRGHVWALRHEAWVRLGERVGAKSELVPHSEVVKRGSSSITHLQVLEDQVLGLQANPPALHAWRSSSEDSDEAGSFYRWRLPKFAKWQGFCAAGDLLYLAGMSKADGAVGIWQVPLPRKLRPSDPRDPIAKEE